MAEYILENELLKVLINSKGCELYSVIRKSDQREFMWNGNPDAWKRHAPVLFPLIGRYKEDQVQYEGRTYAMSQHGFARDMEFTLVEQDESHILMKLSQNEATMEKYPFEFELYCGYELKENTLKAIWKVQNSGRNTMYFSLGGHPAFVGEKDSLADAQVHFENCVQPLQYGLLNNQGLLLDDLYKVELDASNNMQLSSDFFDRDALVFENHQCHDISLVENGKIFVTVRFNAPVFGIWSAAKKNVPFVCIEPWYGRTDRAGFNGDLTNREWSNSLEAGKSFDAEYDLIFAKK